MKCNKNTLQNETFECWAREHAKLKFAKTELGTNLNPKGSALFYQNSITTSWIVASNRKKKVWIILFYMSLYVCACFFFSPSSQMLDELPWQVSHLRFLLEGKIVQRSATLFIFTVYLPRSGVSGTSQFVYKCNKVSFFVSFFPQMSSVSQPTRNNIFHPLLLDNSASAHLDTQTLSRPRLWSDPNECEAPFFVQWFAKPGRIREHVGARGASVGDWSASDAQICKLVLDLFWLTLDQ